MHRQRTILNRRQKPMSWNEFRTVTVTSRRSHHTSVKPQPQVIIIAEMQAAQSAAINISRQLFPLSKAERSPARKLNEETADVSS